MIWTPWGNRPRDFWSGQQDLVSDVGHDDWKSDVGNDETREHKVKEKIENNGEIGHVVSGRHRVRQREEASESMVKM